MAENARLLAILKEYGLTRDALAKRAGVSPPVIGTAVRGETVSPTSAELIVRALLVMGIDVPNLFPPEQVSEKGGRNLSRGPQQREAKICGKCHMTIPLIHGDRCPECN